MSLPFKLIWSLTIVIKELDSFNFILIKLIAIHQVSFVREEDSYKEKRFNLAKKELIDQKLLTSNLANVLFILIYLNLDLFLKFEIYFLTI